MADDLLETYLRQLIESHAPFRSHGRMAGRRAYVDGVEFFRRSVELAKRYLQPA